MTNLNFTNKVQEKIELAKERIHEFKDTLTEIT